MNAGRFPPSRQRGLIIHLVLILLLVLVTAVASWQAYQSRPSLTQTIYILIAVIAFFPLPFLIYRAYALMGANYILSRENLRLQWGLRVEEIPISDVEWVRSMADLASPLPLPMLRLPGSLLGIRRYPDLGLVEFLASETGSLLLVATARRIFAISPADPAGFVQNFSRTIEMGSLVPVPARSQYPSFVVIHAWESRLARYLWLAGFFLNIGLLVWVSQLVPRLERISLGFTPSGAPMEPVPGVQLILLPILSTVLFVSGWVAGLFFYRRQNQRMLSFIIWGSGALTALLFLVAVLFILTTPV